MKALTSTLAFLAFAALSSPAFAADTVIHNQEAANSPFASSVVVPPGYTTYYISGSGPLVADAAAPAGSVQRLGNTGTQTASTLENLRQRMAALGLTMGDVVQGRVYLAADPYNGGKMDYAGMNAAWMKVFGSPDQPNKPARATVQVANLVVPGVLVEIELIAVKKVQ
ncbi:MAG TPA: RidA family protein [Rhizomicrobium sp.]|nr:RidA family protein [Rhizomicrobium sp.]